MRAKARFINQLVADYYQVDIATPSREFKYSHPRQIAHYLVRKHTSLSLSQIARFTNLKDHTTILFSLNKVKKLLVEDADIIEEIADIEAIIENKLKNTQNSGCVITNNKL